MNTRDKILTEKIKIFLLFVENIKKFIIGSKKISEILEVIEYYLLFLCYNLLFQCRKLLIHLMNVLSRKKYVS